MLKLVDDDTIIGSIRYKNVDDMVDVGRLMIHPHYRHRGLAQKLLSRVDRECPNKIKELYTCTKSWSNIRLYEKMGYKSYRVLEEKNRLSFVYMRKK